MTEISRDAISKLPRADQLVMWAVDNCDSVEIRDRGNVAEKVTFRIAGRNHEWVPGYGWEAADGECVALLMVASVEGDRDAMRESLRAVRRVLSDRLEEIGTTVAHEIMDVLHESAWSKE